MHLSASAGRGRLRLRQQLQRQRLEPGPAGHRSRRLRPGRRRPDDLPVAALHRPGQGRNPGRVRKGDGGRRQVGRRHQRQLRVLREDAAAALQRRLRRPQPDHRQRLAGEENVRARLHPEARLLAAAEREGEPDPGAAASRSRSEPRIHRPLAGGDDGADRPHRSRARSRFHLRPLRPQVQGQGRRPERNARHGADDAEVHGHRPRTCHPGPVDGSRRQDQGRSRIRADPPLHRQRLHQRSGPRRRRLRPRLVGRRGAAAERQPEHQVRDAEGGLHALGDEHGGPGRRSQPGGRRGVHELRLRPEGAGRHRRIRQLRDPGEGREGDPRQAQPGAGEEPADLPEPELHEELLLRTGAGGQARRRSEQSVPGAAGRLMRTLSIAALQTVPVFRDPAATLDLLRERVLGTKAVVPDVDLILLLELHLAAQPRLLDEQASYPDEVAVELPGPLTEALAEIASGAGVWLVPGTVFERAAAGRIPNPALAFSPQGELVARYRKVFPWQPHEECAPGDEFVTFDIPGVARVGLASCYDGTFPEAFRALAWMGAEVILQPTLTTTSDREAELVLARGNAIANQLYVVSLNAAAPAGRGRSLIADPEGIVRIGAGDAEELITDVLDLDAVTRVRRFGTAGVSRIWDQAKRLVPELELPMYARPE